MDAGSNASFGDYPSQVLFMRSRDQRTLLPVWALFCIVLGLVAQVRNSYPPAERDVTAPSYNPRIAINNCDWPELCLLPGISETRARNIVADRRARGPFRQANDLQRVSGIGPRTQDRVAPWLDFSCPGFRATVGDTKRSPSLN